MLVGGGWVRGHWLQSGVELGPEVAVAGLRPCTYWRELVGGLRDAGEGTVEKRRAAGQLSLGKEAEELLSLRAAKREGGVERQMLRGGEAVQAGGARGEVVVVARVVETGEGLGVVHQIR